MNRIDLLEAKVRALYEANTPNRNDWTDWLYTDHLFVVKDFAKMLAIKYNANLDLSIAAAILHDIADTKIKRTNPDHEKVTLQIARNLLTECKFTDEEISIVVDDALQFHSCTDGQLPQTREGKILATADAMGHLMSNFYDLATRELKKEMKTEEIKKWVMTKIERDLHDKIFFDDERQKARIDYQRMKNWIENEFE